MKLRKNILELLKLSYPIIIGQLGLMMIGAGDVYVASLYSTQSVAAIGVANSSINPIFLFGLGLMMGISPSLSRLRGAGEEVVNRLSTLLAYGLYTGLGMTVLALLWNECIPYIGIDESLVSSVMRYNKIVAWSFPFATMFQAMKEYLQSREEVFLPNIISMIAVFFNLGLNYILVFGFGSFEAIGEVGLAYASIGTRVFLFLILLIPLLKTEKMFKVDKLLCFDLLKFSTPIAIMFLFEVAAFCLVGILGGHFGVVAAATNNIALTLGSIAFMIPMSISSAASVKVGHAYGRKHLEDVKLNIKSSLILSLFYVIGSSFIFLKFPQSVMEFFTQDKGVIDLGVDVLLIVAIFQGVDCFQVVLNGILRGLDKVKVSSMCVLIAFWVFGIPSGLLLAFYFEKGIIGLWIGLAVGLGVIAFLLAIYLKLIIKNNSHLLYGKNISI